jgi:carboxyl-terminal processing protease
MMHRTWPIITAIAFLLAAPVAAAETAIWHTRIDSRSLGPVELYLEIEFEQSGLRARSLSGSLPLLRELPGERNIVSGLMAFEASPDSAGTHQGLVTAPWKDGEVALRFEGDRFEGTISDGIFGGSIAGNKVEHAATLRDYPAILEDFDTVVAARLFSPDDLQKEAYLRFRAELGRVADIATDDLDLLFGFRWLWQNDPFSHFQLKRSAQSAAEMFAFFDSYRVGFEAATVEFTDDVAVLTVRTMMGADTIEQIDAAFERIAGEDPAALIIDLRGNGGGAFAVKPLIEHVIDEPVDAGFFISQVWGRSHRKAPSAEEVLERTPWEGWSIIAFWQAVQETDILRLRFNPKSPNYDGPVFVLLDARSASATELAADALRSSGVTTLVGQRSAGEMLSQSMFDVRDGFMVSLPVADYYSIAHGRIEGTGVPVDIEAEPDQALAVAKDLARNRSSRRN